jgi:hypothetical protein
MIRYYIADIQERCGEYSFNNIVRFALREPEKDFFNTPEEVSYQQAEKYCDEIAKYWYGGEEEDVAEERDENWYSFNGGEVAVKYGFHKQISKETFEDLGSFVSDHSSWEVSKWMMDNSTLL